MKRIIFVVVAFALALLLAQAAWAEDVLILYDDYDGPWNYGSLFANMTANLVNHYGFESKFMKVCDYQTGYSEHFNYVIYIGSVYANAASSDFLDDVANKRFQVFWINYNLWQLTWDPNYSVDWGFSYLYGVAESDYFSVEYNGQVFDRHENYKEYNLIEVTDANRASVKAWLVSQTDPNDKVPYIVQGDGLWYCADNPFSWLTDGSRYVVFADTLGEFLGYQPTRGLRAMVRFEDNAPIVSNPKKLLRMGRRLKRMGVPFALGVIPVFKDPLGEYFGYPVQWTLSDDPELVDALKKLQNMGGTLILHGYTHQYDGATGDDYEFWLEDINDPVPEDSESWVQDRIDRALAECEAVGIQPDIWETPHYSASQLDYQVFYSNFGIGYERTRIYNNFDSNVSANIFIRAATRKKPAVSLAFPSIRGAEGLTLTQIRARSFLSAGAQRSEGKEASDADVYTLQYVTFPVPKSIYGNFWIPENMGYIDPGMITPSNLMTLSQKYAALTDPVASFFYHHDYPVHMLVELINGMKAQGYRFVSVDEILNP